MGEIPKRIIGRFWSIISSSLHANGGRAAAVVRATFLYLLYSTSTKVHIGN